MRTIKFRAWSKTYQEMIRVESIDFAVDRLIGRLNHGVQVVQPVPMAKGVLMQFTGLLDKNGKEIYEGDIVRWFPDGEGREREVYFDEKDACFQPLNLYVQTFTEFETIGNIHENPELMTRKAVEK